MNSLCRIDRHLNANVARDPQVPANLGGVLATFWRIRRSHSCIRRMRPMHVVCFG
jgi:hypothetical protein